MQALTIFYIFIAFIVLEFIIEKYLDRLNARHFKDALPDEVADVYDTDAYQKSQEYKLTNHKFDQLTSWLSFAVILFDKGDSSHKVPHCPPRRASEHDPDNGNNSPETTARRANCRPIPPDPIAALLPAFKPNRTPLGRHAPARHP